MDNKVLKKAITRFIPIKVEGLHYKYNDRLELGDPVDDLYEIQDRVSLNKVMINGETLKGIKEDIVDICNAMNGKYAYKINYDLEWVD